MPGPVPEVGSGNTRDPHALVAGMKQAPESAATVAETDVVVIGAGQAGLSSVYFRFSRHECGLPGPDVWAFVG